MQDLRGKKVAALLSGGVDSSVAVALLVEQGVRPDLWYIQIGPDRDQTDFTCTIEEDLEMARAVAAKYRLPLQVIDLHRDYWAPSVPHMTEGYMLTLSSWVMSPSMTSPRCSEMLMPPKYE